MHANSLANLRRGSTSEQCLDYRNIGKPPNWLRAEHQGNHAKLLSKLAELIEEGQEVPRWLVQALETTGKFGLGEVKSVDLQDDQLILQTCDVIADFFKERGLEPSLAVELVSQVMERLKSQ